jgi:hypothetical protein
MMYHPIRHAVAINNIGVTLLGKKCYGQAIDTFHDAIYLMQQIIVIMDPNPPGIQASQSSLLSSACSIRHTQACQRLANLHPYYPVPPTGMIDLQVVDLFSMNENKVLTTTILQEQQQQQQQATYPTSYHAIRLEGRYNDTYDCHPHNMEARKGLAEGTVPEFESSILLHNLGLAYLCMSMICCHTTPTTSSIMMTTKHHDASLSLKYRNKAFQCFGKSYVIYAKTLSLSTSSPYSKDCLDRIYHLQGIILIVRSILQTFQLFRRCCTDVVAIPSSTSSEYDDVTIQYYQAVMDHTIQQLHDTHGWNHMVGLNCVTASAA